MLPQTNLQLYRVMIEAGATDDALSLTRTAYDVARRQFAACYRPSHKPFICHLVGAAGALALWGEPAHVVVAGLLHSVYLFGNFGDGTRGMTDANRKVIAGRVGAIAEAMIAKYTAYDWTGSLDDCIRHVHAGGCQREVMLLKLADLCDECCDAGPHFAPVKPLEFGLPHDALARKRAADLVDELAGPQARSHFAAVLEECASSTAPTPLVTTDRSFHEVRTAASPSPRRRIRLRLRSLADAWGRKRAA
jgi:hypothetical protein